MVDTRNRRLGPWASLSPIYDELGNLQDQIDVLGGLEDIDVKVLWFEQINSGTGGSFSAPTGGTILLDQWSSGVDVLVSGISSGIPTFESVLDTDGVTVSGTLDGSGNWTISGTPDGGYPISLIYVYRVDLVDLDYTKALESSQVAGPGALKYLGELSFEITGFSQDAIDGTTIGFDNGTMTFDCTPTGSQFSVWVQGREFIYASQQTATITDTEGIWAFFVDDDGVFKTTQSIDATLVARKGFVSIVYWDATNKEALIFGNERHGVTMDGATHIYLHQTRGTQYISGLQAGDIVVNGDGDLDPSAQLSLTDGVIADEDIILDTSGSGQSLGLPAQLPGFYLSGTAWRKDAARDFPVKNATTGNLRIAYNQVVGGSGSQVEASNNDFVLTHIFCSNDSTEPVFFIQGQDEYPTLGTARAGALVELRNIYSVGLPSAEFAPLYTIIFQTSNGYTNGCKGRIRSTDTGDDFIDWRNQEVFGGGGSGSGNVSGPGSSVDNAVVRFDGTSGSLIQESGVILDDSDFFNFPDGSGLKDLSGNIAVQIDDAAGVVLSYAGVSKFETTSPGATVNGDLTVTGDLLVSGTTVTLDTQTVLIEDNLLLINNGEVGAGVTAGVAGIEVDRGSLTNYLFQFDESDDSFKIGETGSLQKVATREDTPTNDFVVYWNSSVSRLDTAGSLTYTSISSHIADSTIHFTEASIDHASILNIGTNTHTQIDTHISNSAIHFTEASIDHANILNIGTNTHAQIDSHISDASIHFTEGAIDHVNILNIGTNTHAQIDSHIADSTIHFTEGSIDHANILNIGTNTHTQIDTHISDLTIHFTEGSIDHTGILNIGTNTHAQIDTHISDATIHFTEGSINHTSILNVGTNTHAQIDTHIADATIHFTQGSIDHTGILNIGTNTHAQIDTHVADSTIHFTEGSIDHDALNSGASPPVGAHPPAGGTVGQVLEKASGTDYDMQWTDAASVFPSPRLIEADQFLNPINSDWTVNALAPLVADPTNAAIGVRRFDDTTPQGVGLRERIPAGATNIDITVHGRAQTAPTGTDNVALDIYTRGQNDGAAIPAWSSAVALGEFTVSDTNFKEQTFSITVASLGGSSAADEVVTFEITRDVTPPSGSNLVGNFLMDWIEVEFS